MTPAPDSTILPWRTTAQARDEKADKYMTLADRYRITAKEWAGEEAAASLLEETRCIVLAELARQSLASSVAASERDARCSPGYREHITAMVEARRRANLKKVQLKYIEMVFYTRQGADADRRAEMRLTS